MVLENVYFGILAQQYPNDLRREPNIDKIAPNAFIKVYTELVSQSKTRFYYLYPISKLIIIVNVMDPSIALKCTTK